MSQNLEPDSAHHSKAPSNNPPAFELSTSYQLCQDDFKSLLRIATNDRMKASGAFQIMLENYGRFILWGDQAQVLLPRAQESLWNTLQTQPAMKETLQSTFQLISRCLKQALGKLEASLASMDDESLSNCAEDFDTNNSSDSEDSDISSTCGKTPLEEPVHVLLRRLYDQIDFLFQVSSLIRHKEFHSRHHPSSTPSNPSIDLEMDQIMVRSIIEYWREAKLEDDKARAVGTTESKMIIALSSDDMLVNRIAAAIAQRRIKLAQVASQSLLSKSETHEPDERASVVVSAELTLDDLQLNDLIPSSNVNEPVQTGDDNKNPRLKFDHASPPNSPISTRKRNPRPSKPKITTGCSNCKLRRIKCDEKRPACTQCVRSKKECKGYPPPPSPRHFEEVAVASRPEPVIASNPVLASSTFAPQRRVHVASAAKKRAVSPPQQPNDLDFYTFESIKLRVPHIPLINEKYFDCPLCHDQLESYKITDRPTWKRHVYGDLRPYLCTYQDCSSPDRTYATRYDWIYHERQMHQIQWRCRECHEIFHSKATLTSHLEQSHTGLWSATQIAILSDMSEEPQEDESEHTCPFCLQKLTLAKLSDHVAEHLEELSLYSLPEVHQQLVSRDYQSDQD